MKLFVTGGAGFIGANFIRHLILKRSDIEIVNYDKLTYAGNLDNLHDIETSSRYRFVRGDIADAASVLTAMDGCDCVVHFAAESHVDRSIYDPSACVATNVLGTSVLLQVARRVKVRRFIHISTDEVYGDLEPGQASDESFPLRPSSPYAASKAGADLLVKSYVRTYDFPAIITRASNNYGPFQFPEKLIPLMIARALEGRTLPVYGDGQQERDWLHVEDHCSAIILVLERGSIGETYNIGGGNVLRNLDLVRQILTVLDRPESLISFVADRPGHDRRYALDCRKISSHLGWRPEVSFADGIRKTAQWYQDNRQWLDNVQSGDYQRYYSMYYQDRDASLKRVTAGGANQ